MAEQGGKEGWRGEELDSQKLHFVVLSCQCLNSAPGNKMHRCLSYTEFVCVCVFYPVLN